MLVVTVDGRVDGRGDYDTTDGDDGENESRLIAGALTPVVTGWGCS
ncbi:hypothetical protein [Salinibacterium sp. PAMC 21357]|nr:hypothetical protein [Salinibacterium sp. PAMC 21357]